MSKIAGIIPHGLPANALSNENTRLIFDFFEEKDRIMDIKQRYNYADAIVEDWMKPVGFSWTAENNAKLKKAWNEGNLSASQIADEIFGRQVSRFAVIGRANRMGLTKKKSGGIVGLSGRGRGSPRIKRQRKESQIRKSPEIGMILPAVKLEKIEAPQTDGTPLLELKSFQCVFPIADETEETPMLFCGYKRWDKSSYCKYHHKVCHLPLPPKKKNANFVFPR